MLQRTALNVCKYFIAIDGILENPVRRDSSLRNT